jgi:Trypsin-like peptidase domain
LLARKLAALGAALVVALCAASPAAAQVHPGVQTFTEGAQCTANFIFSDGASTYIGQAAHCSSTGAANDTNGCEAESLPNGTQVEIDGASRPGTMVYNSWLAMQAAGESNDATCFGNDFALVRLDPADAGSVDAGVPFFGGPTGLRTEPTAGGDDVYSYGNSSLRGGAEPLSPKRGTAIGMDNEDWTHNVYTATPGIPGDSGSGFLDAEGMAFGVLSTVAVAPFPASNQVSDLGKALAYMRAHGGPGASLVTGGPFSTSLL